MDLIDLGDNPTLKKTIEEFDPLFNTQNSLVENNINRRNPVIPRNENHNQTPPQIPTIQQKYIDDHLNKLSEQIINYKKSFYSSFNGESFDKKPKRLPTSPVTMNYHQLYESTDWELNSCYQKSCKFLDSIREEKAKNRSDFYVDQIKILIYAQKRIFSEDSRRELDLPQFNLQPQIFNSSDYTEFFIVDYSDCFEITLNPVTLTCHELLVEAIQHFLSKPDQNPSKYRLRLSGRVEYLNLDACLSSCKCVELCFRDNKPLCLVLELNSDEFVIDYLPMDTTNFIDFGLYFNKTRKAINFEYLEKFHDTLVEQTMVLLRILDDIDSQISLLPAQFESFDEEPMSAENFDDEIDEFDNRKDSLNRNMRICQDHISQSLKGILIGCFRSIGTVDLFDNLSAFNETISKIGSSFQTNKDQKIIRINTNGNIVKSMTQVMRDATKTLINSLETFSNAFFLYAQIPVKHNTPNDVASKVTPTDETPSSLDSCFNCSVFFRALHIPINDQNILSSFDETSIQHKQSSIYIRSCITYCGRTLESLNDISISSSFSNSSSVLSSMKSDYVFLSCEGKIQTNQHVQKCIRFDSFTKFVPIKQLPREAVLSIVVLRAKKNSENELDPNSATLIGWANQPLFSSEAKLINGKHLIGIWPAEITDDQELRSFYTEPNRASDALVLEVDFNSEAEQVKFPAIQVGHDEETDLKDEKIFESLADNAIYAINYACNSLILASIDTDESLSELDKAIVEYKKAIEVNAQLGLNIEGLQKLLSNISVSRNSEYYGDAKKVICYPLQVLPTSLEILWNLRSYIRTEEVPLSLLLSRILLFLPRIRNMKKDNAQRNPPAGFRNCCSSKHERSSQINWTKVLTQVYSYVESLKPISITTAIGLLKSTTADRTIRNYAVRSLSTKSPDILATYIPQLVTCLSYELYLDWSGLFQFLIHTSIVSINFANQLFWYLLSQCPESQSNAIPLRSYRPLQLMSALRHVSGLKLNKIWDREIDSLNFYLKTSRSLENQKDEKRLSVIHKELSRLSKLMSETSFAQTFIPPSQMYDDLKGSISNLSLSDDASVELKKIWQSVGGLFEPGLRIPINIGLLTHSLVLSNNNLRKQQHCSYFASRTKPLKLVFNSMEMKSDPILLMFKTGDDLSLDSLVCQLIQLMDHIWLSNNLDLKVKHFQVLPTGPKHGIVELVQGCDTLRQIQRRGESSRSIIYNWLKDKNKKSMDSACDNFVRSLAASCVITYVLGLGDRHNDNIMICNTGQIFHIDFSKSFGQSQKALGIKRDRVPFILVPEFLYVVEMFQSGKACSLLTNQMLQSSNLMKGGIPAFIDMTCCAFRLIRDNVYHLLNLVEIAQKNPPQGLPQDACSRIYSLMRKDLDRNQLHAHFIDLIKESSEAKFPILNNLIHILAQSGSQGENGTNCQKDTASRKSLQLDFIDLSDNPNKTDDQSPLLNESTLSLRKYDSTKSSVPTSGSTSTRNSYDNQIQSIRVEKPFSPKIKEYQNIHFYPIQIFREGATPETIYRQSKDLVLLINSFMIHNKDEDFSKLCEKVIYGIYEDELKKEASSSNSTSLLNIDKWFDHVNELFKDNSVFKDNSLRENYETFLGYNEVDQRISLSLERSTSKRFKLRNILNI